MKINNTPIDIRLHVKVDDKTIYIDQQTFEAKDLETYIEMFERELGRLERTIIPNELIKLKELYE